MPLPPATSPVCFTLLVAVGLYLGYEAWRWFTGNRGQLERGQFRRRISVGLLFETVFLIWFLANPLTHTWRPRPQLLYLLTGTLLSLAALLLAVLLAAVEATFVSRQYARWRSDLARKMGEEKLPPDE